MWSVDRSDNLKYESRQISYAVESNSSGQEYLENDFSVVGKAAEKPKTHFQIAFKKYRKPC